MMSNLNYEAKEEIMSIYLQYPFLVPLDDYKKWEGVIYSQGKRYHLMINTPNYPSIKGHTLFCSQKLDSSDKTANSSSNYDYDSLLSLLNDVSSRLSPDVNSSSTNDMVDLDQLHALAQIVSDVEQYIGRNNVDSMDSNSSWIRLKYEDSSGHDSFITIGLEKNYPESILRITDVDLPDEVLNMFVQVRRLGDLYNCFKETVESLVPFWNIMSDLAEEAWIIEPLEPTRKDIHRRLYLSDNLSVLLTFSPMKIDSMPDIKFLGSLTSVSQARDTYQKNLQDSGWWGDTNLVSNLCRLLHLDALPQRGGLEDFGVGLGAAINDDNDCAICYEVSVEGEPFPAKWCSNKNCSGRFHHACLMEWMNSVPTSKTSFDHVSGPCPHCDEKIFCPIKLK